MKCKYESGSPFYLKNLINIKQRFVEFCKLSRMIENYLTKKINPNTNILNSVINAVQTFKELCT